MPLPPDNEPSGARVATSTTHDVPRGSGTATPQRNVPFGLILSLTCLFGLALGLGGFTLRYANGLSYFSSAPSACVNCHIMQPQFSAWQKSSHHAVAVCIDCHLPHDFLPKYLAKAENGYRHSKEFTAGNFAEPIFVQQRGSEILQENCVRCHSELVAELAHSTNSTSSISCVRCHSAAGHGDNARLGGPLRAAELGGLEAP